MRLVPKNQGGNVLNTLGGYWKNLSDWFNTKQQGTALDEMGHPIMQANGELAETYFSPKQEVAAATIATLPATVMSMGFPAFVGGVGEAYLGSSIGGPVGASTIESLGGNEDALQMGYDIGGLLGGYAGFMRGKGILNYSKNKLYSWHSPEKDSDIPYTTPKRHIHQYNNRTGAHNNPEVERIRHEIEAGYPEPTGRVKTRKPVLLKPVYEPEELWVEPKRLPGERDWEYTARYRASKDLFNARKIVEHAEKMDWYYRNLYLKNIFEDHKKTGNLIGKQTWKVKDLHEYLEHLKQFIKDNE